MSASIIIRTLNESRYLGELLAMIGRQVCDIEIETLIVDSGSTDATLSIAEANHVRILHIEKDRFTFGRSLNVGCEAASGDTLVFISGHCVPADIDWLANLIRPLAEGNATYSYGRQFSRDGSPFSEGLVFEKYYPPVAVIPQQGFFCNNANAALSRGAWEMFRFNEELTGLEDMYLAKQLQIAGHDIAYVAEAGVFHIHNETWRQVKRRYQREAIALKEIMPEVYMSLWDLFACIGSSIFTDSLEMARQKRFGALPEIVMYRLSQYLGSYLGSHEHRKLTREMKRRYFYPNDELE